MNATRQRPCAIEEKSTYGVAEFHQNYNFFLYASSCHPERVGRNQERVQCPSLASLVAVHSPVSNTSDTLLTRRLFNGHFHQLRGDTKMISVMADAIVCSVGIVDITAYSCKLTFGAKTVNLTGRAAHELYATMAEAGVQSQNTANALSEGLSHLMCTINPLEIAKRSGGGADCKFDAGM